jgi:hypothetical protein
MQTIINYGKSYIDVCKHTKECRINKNAREGSAFNCAEGSLFGLLTIYGKLPGDRKEKILSEMVLCNNNIVLRPLYNDNSDSQDRITNNELVNIIENIQIFQSVTVDHFDKVDIEKIRASMIMDKKGIFCRAGEMVSFRNCPKNTNNIKGVA